jgi:hypothetical protein
MKPVANVRCQSPDLAVVLSHEITHSMDDHRGLGKIDRWGSLEESRKTSPVEDGPRKVVGLWNSEVSADEPHGALGSSRNDSGILETV